MRRTALASAATLVAVASLAATPLASSAPRVVTGERIVYMNGFDVKLWDRVNGLRTIGRTGSGGEPAISVDGRRVAYADSRGPAGCYDVVVLDVDRRFPRSLPLPGANGPECATDLALSPDGRVVAWSDDSRIFMYDVDGRRPITVPAGVNTDRGAQSPSFARTADGRNLLAWQGAGETQASSFSRVTLADLGPDLTAPPAAVTPLATPGLPLADGPRDGQRDVSISADGRIVAFTTGPELGGRVLLYDRVAGTTSAPPALSTGFDVYDAVPNTPGTRILFALQARDLGDRSLRVLNLATGVVRPLRALTSSVTDDAGSWADPVPLRDVMPPRATVTCRKVAATTRCRMTVDEAVRAAVTLRSGRKVVARRTVRTKAAVTRRRVVLGANGTRVRVVLRDTSGNRTITLVRVR